MNHYTLIDQDMNQLVIAVIREEKELTDFCNNVCEAVNKHYNSTQSGVEYMRMDEDKSIEVCIQSIPLDDLEELERRVFTLTPINVYEHEQRVYMIDVDMENDTHPDELTDDQFMDKAEEQGSVYSLSSFCSAFNNDEIGQYDTFIRII